MKVLLVNSRPSEPQGGELEPIGLCYLTSMLRAHGHECSVIQQDFLDSVPDDRILDRVRRGNVGLVGFSTYVTNTASALSMCKRIKEECGAKTVLGGPLASTFPSLPEREEVDFLVQGEGEYALLGLANALEAGKDDFSQIPNLFSKTNGEIRQGVMGQRIKDLDALPFPDRDHILFGKMHTFGLPHVEGQSRTYSVLASRGCPYACAYCVSDAMWRRQYFTRSVDNFLEELRTLFRPGERNMALFVDEDSFADRERSFRLFDALESSGLGLTFAAGSHIHHLDEDMIGPMRRAGCFQVYFGIESGSAMIHEKVNRRYDFEKSIALAKVFRKNNIMTFCGFIVGFPWDDRATLAQTRGLVRRLETDFFTFQYMQPYPGTVIHDIAVREGWCKPDYFLRPGRGFLEPLIPTFHLTKRELRREYIRIQLTAFLSPRYWARVIRTLFSDPPRMKVLGLVLFNVAQYSFSVMGYRIKTRLNRRRSASSPRAGSS